MYDVHQTLDPLKTNDLVILYDDEFFEDCVYAVFNIFQIGKSRYIQAINTDGFTITVKDGDYFVTDNRDHYNLYCALYSKADYIDDLVYNTKLFKSRMATNEKVVKVCKYIGDQQSPNIWSMTHVLQQSGYLTITAKGQR